MADGTPVDERQGGDRAMEQRLRRAVLDKLEGLGETAGYAEVDRLVPMARTEIRRLTDGWRTLLATHQPDDDGRCPQCSGWLRRRRWPCPVWLAAHQHLIGEGLTHRDRRQPLRNAFSRRRRPVVLAREVAPVLDGPPPGERVWRVPEQEPTALVATPVGGRLETSSERIHRASVVERPSKLPGPRTRPKVRL